MRHGVAETKMSVGRRRAAAATGCRWDADSANWRTVRQHGGRVRGERAGLPVGGEAVEVTGERAAYGEIGAGRAEREHGNGGAGATFRLAWVVTWRKGWGPPPPVRRASESAQCTG
eukprot:gene9278-biopygen2495